MGTKRATLSPLCWDPGQAAHPSPQSHKDEKLQVSYMKDYLAWVGEMALEMRGGSGEHGTVTEGDCRAQDPESTEPPQGARGLPSPVCPHASCPRPWGAGPAPSQHGCCCAHKLTPCPPAKPTCGLVPMGPNEHLERRPSIQGARGGHCRAELLELSPGCTTWGCPGGG